MNKKYIAILGISFVAMMIGIITLAITTQNNAKETFVEAGYVLTGDDEKQVSFDALTSYKVSQTGVVEFKDEDGDTAKLTSSSFVHFDDDSIMALCDGVILDFADLSSNFINNYYTDGTLYIEESGDGYSVVSESGTIELGEHIWKLSDDKYLIRSNTLYVYFSDDDIREVSDYIEISITEDGIAQILTEDNIWMTISEQCYIETEGGVVINPITQIINDGTYKVTVSKLVVSADDSIVLTEDETYRQIVPQINITTIDGEDGSSGDSGTDGESGESGEGGDSGESGEAGNAGDDGASGSSGVNGSTGSQGVDSTVESSTNTALPTMTIIDWNVTQTSLSATIQVGGGAEALELSSSDYDGTITITNATTGEVIYCYETDSLYNIGDSDYTGINFRNAVDVSFSTLDSPLEADTEYILSVKAYYTLNDVIYSREFISRTFYTDSSGLQMAHVSSGVDDATIEVSATESLGEVRLYVLTPTQNESINFSSLTASDYAATATCTFDEIGAQDVTFEGLESDQEYIVRAVVNGVISSQETSFVTLKESPTWDTTTVPTAYYNRVNGAYEVYRPTVVDNDNGVEKYVYIAYNASGEVVYTKTVYPSDAEPVTFYLDSGVYYHFNVEAYFYDNEKTVTYDLGDSDPIKSEGATLPKVTWTENSSTTGTTFNSVDGTINISLDGESSMTVSESYPITITIYADQVIDLTEEVFLNSDSSVSGSYTMIYNVSANTNYESISVSLEKLLKDTNYTITVSGYINLNDGNGAVYRELGTVSVRTETTNSLIASISTNTQSTTAISETLTMSIVSDGDSTSADEAYVYDELLEGKITVELYKGTGNTRELIGTSYYTGDDLESVYNDPNGDGATGLVITEDDFNLPNLDSSTNYTLVISEVVDETYSVTSLGYQNEFDQISPSSKVITATPTPPDLLVDPTTGVQETPIYNIDASDYGAVYDPTMPDDTTIGYRIASTYDNSQRLAQEVTYYILEYSQFYNALESNVNPLTDDAAILKEVSIAVPNTTDTVPEIAVFFADVTFTSTLVEGSTYADGCYIYQDNSFSRGYCYLFAYTVEYSTNASDGTSIVYTYPNDHSDYTGHTNYYGCGKEMEKTLGVGVAYILNSGMVMAPQSDPEFYTYVYETTSDTVTLHYAYNDADGTISTSLNNETMIEYMGANGYSEYIEINKKQIENNTASGGYYWYEITLPYSVKQGETALLQPIVLINSYVNNYDTIFSTLSNGTYVAEDVYLAEIPLEYDYETLFNTAAYTDAIQITMEPYISSNYILFTLTDAQTASTGQKDTLVDRALALKLTFSTGSEEEGTYIEKEFYSAITTDSYGSTVTFSTAQLGEDFIDKTFFVEAEVYYDNGSQGWGLIEDADKDEGIGYFALQRTNMTDNEELVNDLASYYVYYNSLRVDSSGGLLSLKSTGTSSDFLESLRSTAEVESTYVTTTFSYALSNTLTLTRYFTVGANGVHDNSSYSTNSISDYYVVPKGVSSYALSFTSGNSDVLDSITPTVGSISDNTTVNSIVITSFEVTGTSEIDDKSDDDTTKEVTLTVYTSLLNAKEFTNPVGSVTVSLNSDGTFSSSSDSELRTQIADLAADTEYYLAFSVLMDGVQTTMIDADTSDLAIYSFITIEGIYITPDSNGAYYLNYSYLDKTLQFSYTLNEYIGIDVEYDIYNSADVTYDKSSGTYVVGTSTVGDGTVEVSPAISYADMLSSGILASSSVYYNNTITINLQPSINREDLMPGYTYYIRITASAGDADTKVAWMPFTVTSIGTISALVYVDDATSTSISYLVTIMDDQYSLMSNSSAGAPYVVRFTNSEGNWIKTTYDDQVFYSGTIKQEFILGEYEEGKSTLVSTSNEVIYLEESTVYTMTIYSLLDATHNGYTYPIATIVGSTTELDQDTVQLQSYFFGDTDFATFKTFVNSFWITSGTDSGKNDAAMDVVEDNFSISERSQTTTATDGLYIDLDSSVFTMNASSYLELMLQQSFGVIDDDENQYFSWIEYSITGYTSAGLGVSIYGTSVAEDGDLLFVEEYNSANYPIYTYEIPEALAKGYYTVTVKLHTTDDTTEPVTISGTYYYN